MSFLIFDADKSLSSIGGYQGAEELSGVQPIPVNDGLATIKTVLSKVMQTKEVVINHPLLDTPMIQTVFQPNELCEKMRLEGLVIDSISHTFRQDMRLLEKANKSGQMEMKDWGKIERMYNDFVAKLASLPIWVIVNSHITYDKDGATGNFYFNPQVKGATKDFLAEYFDVVIYTKTNKDKKIYTWQTQADASKYAKDRLGRSDEYIPQDFNIIINAYKKENILNPKILVIGESGTGKTKALMSLSKGK